MRDSILFWNSVALRANRVSHTDGSREQTGPPLSSRALAIVHLAMYDAYAAIDRTAGEAYLPHLPTPPYGATTQAAVAGAAHKALSSLFPSQRGYFDSKLAEAGDTGNVGHNFGRHVARAILADRSADPGVEDSGYDPSRRRGRHRVDPDNPTQGFHGPFYGAKSKGFAITERHELDPPPSRGEPYLWALRQVRGKGIAPELMGTLPRSIARRTSAETLIGIYWGYDGSARLGTPPRLYNQIIHKLAIHCHNTEARNARLLALVNVAMADAGILAWDQKYIHDFWRPVIGIREHDKSMRLLAKRPGNKISRNADPGWLPLGAPATNSNAKNPTPNFPSYPSGHATFGAAAFHIARLFYEVPYGDHSKDLLFDGLYFVSDEFNGVSHDNRGTVRPRHFRSFPGGLWQMIEENARSRVFLGVHWIFDSFMVDREGDLDLSYNIGGVPLGLTIAEDIYKNGMKKSHVGPRKPWPGEPQQAPCARQTGP